MPEVTRIESFKLEGGQILEQIKRLIHEGNIRRIVVKQEGRVIAEFPLTFGVIGAAIAPVLAAISTLAALLGHCTIELEKLEEEAAAPKEVAVAEPEEAAEELPVGAA
jgi:hypothetical protein